MEPSINYLTVFAHQERDRTILTTDEQTCKFFFLHFSKMSRDSFFPIHSEIDMMWFPHFFFNLPPIFVCTCVKQLGFTNKGLLDSYIAPMSWPLHFTTSLSLLFCSAWHTLPSWMNMLPPPPPSAYTILSNNWYMWFICWWIDRLMLIKILALAEMH